MSKRTNPYITLLLSTLIVLALLPTGSFAGSCEPPKLVSCIAKALTTNCTPETTRMCAEIREGNIKKCENLYSCPPRPVGTCFEKEGELCLNAVNDYECPSTTKPEVCQDAKKRAISLCKQYLLCRGDKFCGGNKCVCPSGKTDCGDLCKDFNTDPNNCGRCDNKCTGGKTCQNGSCLCPSGLYDCGGTCRNVQTDISNCGTCGNVCSGGKSCVNGGCLCPSGQTDCGGACKNLANDASNCGACSTVCPQGKVCQNSSCVCPPGKIDCGGTCVDLNSDKAHCGTCQTACSSSETCCSGKCVDTATNSLNCGQCNTSCSKTCSGTAAACSGGKCAAVTSYQYFVETLPSKCMVPGTGNSPFYTYLAATQSEADACASQQFPSSAFVVGKPSAVGNFSFAVYCSGAIAGCYPCRSVSNVLALSKDDGQSCIQFQNQNCTLKDSCAECGSGLTDNCGTCVDLKNDPKNCGKVGTVCGTGQTCCTGRCVNLKTDHDNCGSCGYACGDEAGYCKDGICACNSSFPVDCGDWCYEAGIKCCNASTGWACYSTDTCCIVGGAEYCCY